MRVNIEDRGSNATVATALDGAGSADTGTASKTLYPYKNTVFPLDLKALMKCCIGELIPDGRIIPFCAYNTVGYREQVRAALIAGEMA